jgi:uncharacterized protein (DUF2147 family)
MVRKAVVLSAAAILAAGASAAAAGKPPAQGKGHWTNPVGACVGHIISNDPVTGDYKCSGTSSWTGTWKGSTKWTATGNLDAATGAATGKIHEVFKGKIADGRKGKLVFEETMTLDAKGNIDIRGKIVKSSGGLAGAHGKAHWTGTSSVADGSGAGPYSGSWHAPPIKRHPH